MDITQKRYLVQENKAFLKWYKEQLNNGYLPLLTLEEIQELINKMTIWYEWKYPSRELDKIQDIRFKDIQTIMDNFTLDQLNYRLNDREIEILDCCNYRAPTTARVPISVNLDENKNSCDINDFETIIFLSLYLKTKSQKEIGITATTEGKIINSFNSINKKYLKKTNATTLEELLAFLEAKKYCGLDYTDLKKCILNKQIDKELRKKIIKMASLSLIYSPNTILEHGHYRAEKLIEEFNEYYGLNLSIKEIDLFTNEDDLEEKNEPVEIVLPNKNELSPNKRRRLFRR